MPEKLIAIGVVLIGAGAKAFVYALLLWIMVSLQRLNYTFLGLLLSSLAATATSFIPVAGPYLAYPVLLICLRKVTQAEIFPDCAFTAVIANSLMFVVNLFALGALIGSLRPDLEEIRARSHQQPSTGYVQAEEEKTVAWGKTDKSGLSLRGVSLIAGHPSAMIGCGDKFHTIALDELISVRDGERAMAVKCLEITQQAVVLEIDGHERLKLELR